MAKPQIMPSTPDTATRTFSTSMVISGIRCVLTYLVFPLLLPVLGVTGGVGPGVGLAIGTVAVGFNIWSILRFWRTDHNRNHCSSLLVPCCFTPDVAPDCCHFLMRLYLFPLPAPPPFITPTTTRKPLNARNPLLRAADPQS